MTGVVPPVDVMRFAVPVTDVTPVPGATAQVPSPRQNVLADADVPEFRFVTGKFPVTPVVKGKPVQLVKTPLAGVPNRGPTKVGPVARTGAPLPVNATIEGMFEPSVTSIEFAAGVNMARALAVE